MQSLYKAIYSATVWLGRLMGNAMKRMGFD